MYFLYYVICFFLKSFLFWQYFVLHPDLLYAENQDVSLYSQPLEFSYKIDFYSFFFRFFINLFQEMLLKYQRKYSTYEKCSNSSETKCPFRHNLVQQKYLLGFGFTKHFTPMLFSHNVFNILKVLLLLFLFSVVYLYFLFRK